MRQRVDQIFFKAADSVSVILQRKIFCASGTIFQNPVVENFVAVVDVKIDYLLFIWVATRATAIDFIRKLFERFNVVVIDNDFVRDNRIIARTFDFNAV